MPITMLHTAWPIAIVLVGLATAPARGQSLPNARRTFIDAAVAGDWDDAYSSSARVPGATFAPGIGVGFDDGTWGLELDVTVPQWHEKNLPVQRYRYVGPTFQWQQQGREYESSAAVRRRSVDLMALCRVNRPMTDRVRIAVLFGGGYVFRPEQFSSVTKEVLPDGQLIQVDTRRDTSARNYLAGGARLDVEVKVTSRIGVVPRLRLTIFPSLLDDSGLAPRLVVARPEIAVRWRL